MPVIFGVKKERKKQKVESKVGNKEREIKEEGVPVA